MITLPIVLEYKDISVFPDNVDCNTFYCIRNTPQIRVNDAGDPVFRSIFWSSDKASDKAFAGVLGGRMNFDVNLGINDTEKEAIKQLITSQGIQAKRYNEIIAREKKRENLIAAVTGPSSTQGMSEFLEGERNAARTRIPAVGEVTFGAVNYTKGTFELNEQNGGSLVQWHNGTKRPSMLGDNNSAVAVQFTPEGAAVACKAIQQRAQTVSVRFDMSMRMCMPALNIRVYAGSVQAASISRHFDKGDSCDGTVDSKTITEMLTDMGFINIEVDRYSTDLSDEVVNNIRQSMMGILEKKVEEIINTKILPLTPEEREKKEDLIIEEEFRSFTELNFSENSVFEFSFSPQATICDFFKDLTDEQIGKMVTLIDMSEEIFSFKHITLGVYADWKGKPEINCVKVVCEYPSLPEGHKERVRSFVLDGETASADWEFMKPKEDDGVIKYTPYVFLKGSSDPDGIQLPTQTTKGEYVLVNIGRIGLIDVAFKAHPNVATLPNGLKATSVQVEVWYDDANGKRLMGPEQVLLTDLNGEVKLERNLDVPLDQPLHYRYTYNFEDIDPVTLPEKTFYMGDNGVTTIYGDFPFANRKNLTVDLPTTLDKNVKEIRGEIYYGKYTFPVMLSKEDDWDPQTVKLCSLEETGTGYEYQFKLKYGSDDMDTVSSGRLKGSADSNLLMVPLKKVEMAGIDLLGLGDKYYRATVEIVPSEGCGKPMVFKLTKKDKDTDSKIFYLFCPDDKKLELSWTMTLYDMEGQEQPPITNKTDKAFFILTPPKNSDQ